ncbi:MAG: hypothetical protein ACI3VR_00375 [Intestinibacter sp.]
MYTASIIAKWFLNYNREMKAEELYLMKSLMKNLTKKQKTF